jgi:hypothetical protein
MGIYGFGARKMVAIPSHDRPYDAWSVGHLSRRKLGVSVTMTRYVYRDGEWRDRDGKPMEVPSRVVAPRVISDLPAYMSPLGTGMIDGRRARREDLKRNNCREVAPDEWKPQREVRDPLAR